MVHIIASAAFSLIALAMLSLTLWMLTANLDRILQALHMEKAHGPAGAAAVRPRERASSGRMAMRPAPLLRAAA